MIKKTTAPGASDAAEKAVPVNVLADPVVVKAEEPAKPKRSRKTKAEAEGAAKPAAKRGRKPGTKNTAAPKAQPLAAAQPADLRRLAAVLEEIADLEAQTTKLDTLRAEAEELKNRLTAKQA